MRAAGAADDGQSEEVDNNIDLLRSKRRMLSLLDLTTAGAFSGSNWHFARTQVSSVDSNVLHC